MKTYLTGGIVVLTAFIIGYTGTVHTVQASDAVLTATSIQQIQSAAISDETFEHGWKWVFDVTVPENETILNLMVSNIVDTTDATKTFPLSNVARFYSAQGISSRVGNSVSNPISLSTPGAYGDFIVLDLASDLDSNTSGRQVQVYLDIRVPSTTPAGAYTLNYGIKSALPNYEFDFIAPEIVFHEDITAEATSPAGAPVSYVAPVAYDLVAGPTTVVCLPVSASIFAIGTTPVNCSSTDENSNTGHSTFSVKVQDTTGPVITLIGDAAVQVPFGVPYSDQGATASDLVDGILGVDVSSSVDTEVPGIGSVVYTTVDSAGNVSTVARSVEVVAVTYPITVTTDGNGTFAPAAPVYAIEGQSKTITFYRNYGYQFNTVTVDGVMIIDNDNWYIDTDTWSYTFENVSAPHTIHVTYHLTVNHYKYWKFKEDIDEMIADVNSLTIGDDVGQAPQSAIDAFMLVYNASLAAYNDVNLPRIEHRTAHNRVMRAWAYDLFNAIYHLDDEETPE